MRDNWLKEHPDYITATIYLAADAQGTGPLRALALVPTHEVAVAVCEHYGLRPYPDVLAALYRAANALAVTPPPESGGRREHGNKNSLY